MIVYIIKTVYHNFKKCSINFILNTISFHTKNTLTGYYIYVAGR